MSDMHFTADEKRFLSGIRDDILKRPEFYRPGARHIFKKVGMKAQYRDAMAEHREAGKIIGFGLTNLKPKRRRPTPLFILGPAFAYFEAKDITTADDDLRAFEVEAAKAVLVITWLLTDKDADKQSIGKRFGPWKHPRGRELARAGTLDEDERRGRWMALARKAWDALAHQSATDSAAFNDGYLSPSDVAKALNAPKKADAIRKCLGRLLEDNRLPDGAWMENSDPAKGQAKILYRLSRVRPFLARFERSGNA